MVQKPSLRGKWAIALFLTSAVHLAAVSNSYYNALAVLHPVSRKQCDSLQLECDTDFLLLLAFLHRKGADSQLKHQSIAGGVFGSVGVKP